MTYIAAHDLIVLSIFDDLLDFLDRAINISTDTAHDNDVLVASLSTELDGQSLVLANDPVHQ